MAFFSVVELFGDILISWLPLYYEGKIVFIIWLSQLGGSSKIYGGIIEPWLRKNESHIDAHTETVSQHISDGVSHLRSASFGFIKNKSVEILTMVGASYTSYLS
jgi:receptor expression-enhancing protein 1/2/3/4